VHTFLLANFFFSFFLNNTVIFFFPSFTFLPGIFENGTFLCYFFLLLFLPYICRDKLVIAPCGFDNSIWDPSKDNFLPENYSAKDMKGKVVCRVALQHHLALSNNASAVLVTFLTGVTFELYCFLHLEKLIFPKL
jgi:hypothetical protein